ncbi:F-box domain [Macleaya cordata]|uniref:F-box domain n=1 Tax=Macleaya cordata TaxID=56857 RepID=A0A200QVD0_MACCD|nr:F-box domain [Macleaya cordata]
METRDSPFSNNRDRISNLPETLIHHILSFLDMKWVVTTSILSRRWRYVWTSLPTLNFASNLFKCPNTKRIKGFIDFKDYSFSATALMYKDLCVDIMGDLIVSFPQCLFTCKSLTKLELLMGAKETSKLILPNSMGLPRLKSLKLGSLYINDEKLANMLISSCPVLESLIIEDSYMNLNISSLKFKHFELDNTFYCFPLAMIVKLYAPNLTSYTCKDYMSHDYSLENLSSLVTADIHMKVKAEDEGKEDVPERYSELPASRKIFYAKRMMKLLRGLHNVKDRTLSLGFLEVPDRRCSTEKSNSIW